MKKCKGLVSVLTALFLLLGTIYIPAAAKAVNEITVDEEAEAEIATISSDTTLVSLSNASGGQAISFGGARHDSDLDTIAPDVTFIINVETAGIYVAYGKFWTVSSGDDSVYYAFDNENYIQIAPTNTADFTWVKLGSGYLDPGVHTLNFKRRESGCRLDKVMVAGSEGLYIEPPAAVESGIYPQAITPETIGTVAPFVAGDRVAFIGDSITYGGAFHSQIFNYYATRYPESNFTYINKGIGGDVSAEILERIDHDVYDATFNKAVVMIGMNDMRRGEYFAGSELIAGAAERRKQLMDTYKADTKKIYDSLVSHGIEQIIFVGPSMFDEWLPRENTNKDTSPGFNNVLRKANAYLYDWSTTEDFEFVDVNTPQTIIDTYHKKDDPTFTFISDRIHPSPIGHYIMAYAFLKAQGETGEVATVTVDASQNTSTVSRASISNLTSTSTSVSYTYSPISLPLAADAEYRSVEALLPITSELNRETIKVSGLDDGMYNIKMNDKIVVTCSAADLAEGVNIADKRNNPSQKASLAIKSLTDVKRDREYKYREFVASEINNIAAYKLDKTSNETMLSSARAYVSANASDPAKATDVATLNAYITQKENEANVLAGIKEIEDSVYDSNTPVTSNVVIERSDAAIENTNNKVNYLPFALPENTVRVIPYSNDYKVNTSNVRFTNETGNELTAMPAANSQIKVTADISNDGTSDETAVFWAAIYQNGALKSVEETEISLAAGESANNISVTLTVPAGQNLSVKSGIWNSMNLMNPFVSVADFLSTDVDLKQITIDGEPLDSFNSSVTSYKEYITSLMARAPHIGAVARNNYAKISISDFSLPGTAQITVSGANGAQKVYSIEFANDPVPTLSEIKVDGTAISTFDSDLYGYEYEYPEGDTIVPTVSASAADTELDIQVTQAPTLPGTATITVTSPLGVQKVYTIDFVKESTPGVISNVYMNGSPTTSVYGVPSLGAKLINYYDASKTPEQMLATLQGSDNPYVNNGYLLYSNRTMTNSWGAAINKFYGYNMQFIYADLGSSMFINPKVTRLFKPDTDRAADATSDASKTYEFDISKSATVYITTSGASSYIDGLGTWAHEYNVSKYGINSPAYKEIAATDSTTIKYRIPTGASTYCETARGDVYYKHFSAGERVSIPAYSDTAKSYRSMGVFVVWDECNRESNIYDIKADGTSIGFSKDTLNYTYYLKSDATQVPTISVEAAAGANAQITQATAIDGSAIVNVTAADGSITTYVINFVVRDGDTSLSNLGYTFAGKTTPVALTSTAGDQNKYYEVILPNGFMALDSSELPKLTAEANDDAASVSVTDIDTFPENATLKVTNGSSVSEYTVRFKYEHGEINNLSQKLSSNKPYGVKHDLRPLSFYELRDIIAKEGGVVWEDYCKLYMDRGGAITLSETPSLQKLPSENVQPQLSTNDKENPTYGGDPRYITSYNNYWDISNNKWMVYWFNMWIARNTASGSTSPYFNGATHILTSNDDNKGTTVKTVMDDAISFSMDRSATVYIASLSTCPSYEAVGSGWTKDNTGLQVAQSDQMHRQVYYKHFNANETVNIPTPSVDGGTAQGFGGRMMVPVIVWDGDGSGDTSLASVSAGGSVLASPVGTQYTASATGSLTVTATATDSAATVYIKQAASSSDTAKIYVMSRNECSVYTVAFTN